MNVEYVRLVEEKKEALWNGQRDGPIGHLGYIKERRGEKIVALDADSGLLAGWIGLFPERDEGGPFYSLAGIEVHADHRGRGIGRGLMEEARNYLAARKVYRLKFGTTPLLTACASLYVSGFGTRYRWREGVKLPDGRPWPCVSCECDFDDPLFKPLDLRDDEIGPRSVLEWSGRTPIPRKGTAYSGPLSVVLPEFSADELSESVEHYPGFLETLYSVFDSLFVRGYGFAWFDRIPGEGPRRYYYVMKKVMAL